MSTTTGSESGHARGILVLIALSLVLAFAFQGTRGLFETTEGRYAEAAREMLQTRQWMVPQLDYHPHWSKPPLTYWAIAGSMAVLGENEWAARLPSALSYLLIIAAVYALGAHMWDRRTALAAGIVYATSPLAVVAANSVSTDPILAMWEALAALAYWVALVSARDAGGAGQREGTKQGWQAPRSGAAAVSIVFFWLFAGFGFLTKGPPALLTPLVVFVFHGWLRARRRPAPPLASPVGIPLFLVVGFAWYVVLGVTYHGLLGRLISEEVVGRIASPSFNRNPEWYGPLVLIVPFIVGIGPWLFYWRRAWTSFASWGGWKGRVGSLAGRPAVVFCALWAVVPLIVLSLARSRLPLYVLPFLPALSLVTGRAVALKSAEKGNFKTVFVIAVVTAAVLVGVKGVAAHVQSRSDVRPVFAYLERSERNDELTGEAPKPPETVYAYKLSQEYGLMFYLKGRMTRVLDAPGALAPEDLIAALSDPGRRAPAYIVARARAEELSGLLEKAGLPFEESRAGSYFVFRVGPVSE